ncbi:uncharacterized protein GIQ15_04917 [Arthroderma uncinatum]|uniref:uncharacterized protein n=1 Tax=Arthroderma uncinatum TaxID=74035 RepID=UPI00144A75C0|nr:uncharacterized protein GIQ15_04917 [Arthroderma uncinatum]KAF3482158.1 hypothetical protein GIQ15_04917 [Arthroderma uncinatum]
MASHSNDRILWLCLGVTLFFAARGIAAELYRVKDLTEIRKLEKEEPVIGQATEDALRLETLQRLSGSSSFDLRAAALRIVSERSTKGSTKELLLDDLASEDPERRRKALNALSFLISSTALGRSTVSTRLRDGPTFSALVDCLCNFLSEHTEKTSDIVSPIYPQTRPPGENKALKTLSSMLPGNILLALEAGIVSRWLTNYPFPCAVRDKSKKRSIVFMMKTWWADDPAMGSIINTISSDQEGLNHLRKYGLMGSRMEEHTADIFGNETHEFRTNEWYYRGGPWQVYDSNSDSGSDMDSDVWMVDGEETAGVSPWLGNRPQENTAEEQALRRRRREAMVFSESSRPLVADNIFHPVNQSSSSGEDWEVGERRPSWANQEPDEAAEQAEPESETSRSPWLLWPF